MKTAIIIDDNYATIVLVKNLISYYSFPIEVISEISNGKNAFSAILEKQPDIVFMDISLPDISGLEVIDMLREQRNIDKHYRLRLLRICSKIFAIGGQRHSS